MDEDKILLAMRLMAWERAKGELNSVLQSYWTEEFDDEFVEGARQIVENFLNDFEDYIT
jgi:hypothetical protein